mmetsp:Transcript_18985/g.36504  ORF Transcript_18985/g.36504 Transcript_18985/m.36504 type:complete len:206 (-) Transcript_18985:224-841(-)
MPNPSASRQKFGFDARAYKSSALHGVPVRRPASLRVVCVKDGGVGGSSLKKKYVQTRMMVDIANCAMSNVIIPFPPSDTSTAGSTCPTPVPRGLNIDAMTVAKSLPSMLNQVAAILAEALTKTGWTRPHNPCPISKRGYPAALASVLLFTDASLSPAPMKFIKLDASMVPRNPRRAKNQLARYVPGTYSTIYITESMLTFVELTP